MRPDRKTQRTLAVVCLALIGVGTAGCGPSEPNELEKLGMVTMSIKGQRFKLWIADEPDEQLKGLMFVTADQMKPLPSGTERGMLFVFNRDHTSSFWMKNTIIPLDIAYIAADGRVVKTYTMAPLDDRPNQYPPGEPYRFVVEVRGDRFGKLGLVAGDSLDMPDLRKRDP